MHHKSVKTTVRFYMFRNGMWMSESYARSLNGLNSSCSGDGSPAILFRCFSTSEGNMRNYQEIRK